MKFEKEFFLFAIVGSAGFVVDSVVLSIFYEVMGPYVARILSFTCAILLTWILNRSFTFANKSSSFSLVREFLSYAGLMIGGGMVNYICYVLMVTFVPFVDNRPILGVAAGSFVGLGVNFVTSKKFLFKHTES
jgi:putative flippase GtrA